MKVKDKNQKIHKEKNMFTFYQSAL